MFGGLSLINGARSSKSSVSFEVALTYFTLPLAGGSDAVAAGEGPLGALGPDSPGRRMKNLSRQDLLQFTT